MSTSPVVKGLPSAIAASVGRIVSRWAYQEWLLYSLSYDALGINPKQGRVAVRQPPIGQLMPMIEDLLLLRGVTANLKQLAKDIQSVKERRDELVHAVWVRPPEGLAIQDTRGTWKKFHKRQSYRITKKMQPGFKLITPDYLKTLRADLEETIHQTEHLRAGLNAVLTSLQTRTIEPT